MTTLNTVIGTAGVIIALSRIHAGEQEAAEKAEPSDGLIERDGVGDDGLLGTEIL